MYNGYDSKDSDISNNFSDFDKITCNTYLIFVKIFLNDELLLCIIVRNQIS